MAFTCDGIPTIHGECPSTAFSLFGHTAQMSDGTDAKKILTASPWRTG